MFTTQEAVKAEIDYRREMARGLYKSKANGKPSKGRKNGRKAVRRLRRAWTV